jgi:hypothetical protein
VSVVGQAIGDVLKPAKGSEFESGPLPHTARSSVSYCPDFSLRLK